jgi:hypothetical protein
MTKLSEGLKVHLRVVEPLPGRVLRVVTLRPQTSVVFSTNHFHDTWHLLTDGAGAAILGRLMFGLAYQRKPGTVVLIAPPHLVPTPFEGDPADPILLVPDGLTSIDAELLRALRVRLRRVPMSPTTIRWHTFGMPAAIADDERWYRMPRAERDRLERREKMSKIGGYICYTAPQEILKDTGLAIYRHRDDTSSSYTPLATGHSSYWQMDGEFQTIMRMRDKVSAAVVARRDVIGERRLLAGDDERAAVWSRQFEALDRLTASKRP